MYGLFYFIKMYNLYLKQSQLLRLDLETGPIISRLAAQMPECLVARGGRSRFQTLREHSKSSVDLGH